MPKHLKPYHQRLLRESFLFALNVRFSWKRQSAAPTVDDISEVVNAEGYVRSRLRPLSPNWMQSDLTPL